MGRGKRRGRRGAWRVLALVTGVIFALSLLAAGGLAVAGYQFSERYEGKLLPGVSISGVDLGGLGQAEALVALKGEVAKDLDREIEVVWRKKTWTVTPREIGARGNAKAVIEEAFERSSKISFADKVRMRVMSEGLGFEREVAITYPEQGAQGFVKGLAASFDKDAEDAAIDYSSGWVEINEGRSGRKVQQKKTHEALMQALRNGSNRVELSVKETQPETRKEDFKQVLLVRIGENKLYLYQNGKITHDWSVAPGQPEYPTPTGVFSVTLKRYMPTWTNPSPDGWGANMPASIPPGPGNPLGVRAINWSAPAIRFHGTSATYSLGYNASHGCVRMSNSDVIELYDLIEEGATIVSTQVAPFKPMYRSAPDPTPVGEGSPAAESSEDPADGRAKKKKSNGDD